MNEFDLLRNVTIGQYIPTGSVIHKLDPRVKITALILLIAAVVLTRSLIGMVFITAILYVIVRLARLSVGYMLRGLLLALPLLVVLFVLQFLFQGNTEPAGKVYFQAIEVPTWLGASGFFLRVTRYSLHLIALALAKVLAFIFMTSLLTMTTTVTELTHGMELMLKPLEIVRFPAHEIALTMMIALRFVPTLAEELERIMKAQASRCGDIQSTRTWNLPKAARQMLPLIVPLFLNALRRAEDLILAMEARCYMGGAGRTKFVQFHLTPRDFLTLALTIALVALMAFTTWPPIRSFITVL